MVGNWLPLAVAVVALIGDVVAADCRRHRAGSGARRNHSVDDYRTVLHFRSLSRTYGIIDGAWVAICIAVIPLTILALPYKVRAQVTIQDNANHSNNTVQLHFFIVMHY